MKIGVVVTGLLNSNTNLILLDLLKKFDIVIYSTWINQSLDLINEDVIVLKNEYPENFGIENRNVQRYATYIGLMKAKELNCTHILKWRSDLFGISLCKKTLLSKYHIAIKNLGINDIVITTAWRNLTVVPDWLSSFPDMFMFSTIDMMTLIWDIQDIDLSKSFNMPKLMLDELNIKNLDNNYIIYNSNKYEVKYFFDSHVEFYAWVKYRLCSKYNQSLNHTDILKKYYYLISPFEFKILWFSSGNKLKFRPIVNSLQFRWWREDKKRIQKYHVGWNFIEQNIYTKIINHVYVKIQIFIQFFLYIKFQCNKNLSSK